MKTMIYFRLQDSRSIIGNMLVLLILIAMPLLSIAQNVGIGTDTPTEKLQVEGKVYSSQDGFKFPDGSVQTRAYNAYETQDAAQGRWVIILDNANLPGSFSFGANYQNMIKVIDFDWGLFHNVSEAMVAVTDICHFKLITIIKEIDKSSPKFPQYWENYIALGQATFHFFWYDTNTQTYTEYYKLTFSQIRVVKFNTNLTYIGNDQFAQTEQVIFNFEGNVQFWWFGPPVVQYTLNPVQCGGPGGP